MERNEQLFSLRAIAAMALYQYAVQQLNSTSNRQGQAKIGQQTHDHIT
jgi:hypothetical protein